MSDAMHPPSPSRFRPRLAADPGCCRLCGNTRHQKDLWAEVYAGYGQVLRRCGHCAALYLAPDFSPESAAAFYRGPYRHLFPAEVPWRGLTRFFDWRGDVPVARHRLQRMGPALPPGGQLLELGSGFGAFLGVAAAARPDLGLHACEPDARNRQRLLGAARVHFVDALEDLPAASLDAIVAFHVLEHLADPRAFLEQAVRLLRGGGRVWIEVPDVMAPWRTRNYVHPAHLSYFSAPVLLRLAQACGFDVRHCAPAEGLLEGNLWCELQLPAHPTPPARIAPALPGEVAALDQRIARVGWTLRERLQQRLKRGLIRACGPALVGELLRWRQHRAMRRQGL